MLEGGEDYKGAHELGGGISHCVNSILINLTLKMNKQIPNEDSHPKER